LAIDNFILQKYKQRPHYRRCLFKYLLSTFPG